MEFSCPRTGKECSTCLGIAKEAFQNAYVEKSPNLTQEDTLAVIENARISGPLEEDGLLDDIKCEDRQRRAKIIGKHMGEHAV